MKAFLLAAGRGTRLAPLTNGIPKILAPVLGVPMLDRLVAGLRRHGAEDLALNTHHLADVVTQHLRAGGRGGPRVFHEAELLGTGGALANAAPFWDAPVLLWNGDILAELDVAALWAAHAQGGAVMTMVVSGRDASSHLQVDGAGLVCGIHSPRRKDERVVRAPQGGLRNRAYHGIAVVAPALVHAIARPGAFDLIEALLAAIAAGTRVGTFEAAGFWGTTGSPDELRALEAGMEARPALLRWFTP